MLAIKSETLSNGDFSITHDRFLLADFIRRQNRPTLSIVWHRLKNYRDPTHTWSSSQPVPGPSEWTELWQERTRHQARRRSTTCTERIGDSGTRQTNHDDRTTTLSDHSSTAQTMFTEIFIVKTKYHNWKVLVRVHISTKWSDVKTRKGEAEGRAASLQWREINVTAGDADAACPVRAMTSLLLLVIVYKCSSFTEFHEAKVAIFR